MGSVRVTRILLGCALVACGNGDDGPTGDGPVDEHTLAQDHPGDVGLGTNPAVVWFEDFEAGSVAAITGRYDQSQGGVRMQVVGDRAPGSAGAAALALTAGGGVDAVDLYKQLPDADEWWVRWYAKYEPLVPWHHSGMWFGGYSPGMPFPSPMAGFAPTGDDRFSISIEPVWNVAAAGTRFDYYNYWRGMHSWMDIPTNDGTSYYGNSLVHQNGFSVDGNQWTCLEVHVRLNPDPASAAGAMLEVWKDDVQVSRFDDAAPLGYWIKDKFCPTGADGAECTDFPAPYDQILDLQLRTTSALKLNAFWPQNYITDAAQGTLVFDQMVVATARIGCVR